MKSLGKFYLESCSFRSFQQCFRKYHMKVSVLDRCAVGIYKLEPGKIDLYSEEN